ncbi:glycoside hydrolase domain-containing protein [Actinacidiphila guanduensis]|uniref:Rv2525c-like glycoside hydrolase-like domain-containing protein n=1 Tax=Actinacidiphila guanduensis TaxID=310781 RepID=A0A1G9XUS1_9ACTN|nr:glycoside hydrolase domain-containing protein [Actinacidiphila guanduensis]SDN00231.1 protein of unknown function [Actinacidiphila guanduensis]
MSEKGAFIRFMVTGALALAGLVLPAGTAGATDLPRRDVLGLDVQGRDVQSRDLLDRDLQSPGRQSADPQSRDTQPRNAQARNASSSVVQSSAAHSSDVQRSDTQSRTLQGRDFQGRGFDTCQAPDLATMDAWIAHSDYRAAGIYFGGRARACKSQVHLTPSWVRRTTAAGWSLLPIYVGSQSPCVAGANKNPYRIDTARPTAQGADEAQDAVERAQALGLDPGSALYLDMEAYDIGNGPCASATLKFVRSWDTGVTAAGYIPGFYSSADSGIRQMARARAAGTTQLPQALWYARWGVPPTLTAEPSLDPDTWTPHRRVHQYHGAVTETHGGRSLTIDRDLLDAPVAVVG